MSILGRIGHRTLGRWRFARDLAGIVWGVLSLAVRPRFWARTTRRVLARQILFTGVDALGLILVIGLLTGVTVVVQAQYWLSSFGQSAMLGPLLVAVIIREVGPLLVNLVVIGRSGTAAATELANMRVRDEIHVLESQGMDAMVSLVMPRVLGMGISVFGLTVVLILASLGSGFVAGVLVGVLPGDLGLYTDSLLSAVQPADIVNLLIKTLLPGALTGAISCREGLFIEGSVTDVPRAATSAVVRSIAAVLVVSAVTSVMTYI